MTKRSIAVLGVVGLAGSLLGLSPAEAADQAMHARDTAGCVTKREFNGVRKGWTLRRVHRRFDTGGKRTYYSAGSPSFPAEQWREYRACHRPRWSTIEVDYTRRHGVWRVSSKYAYWF